MTPRNSKTPQGLLTSRGGFLWSGIGLAGLVVVVLVRLAEDLKVGRFTGWLLAETLGHQMMVSSPGLVVGGATVGWGLGGLWLLAGRARGILSRLEIAVLAGGMGVALYPVLIALAGHTGLDPFVVQGGLAGSGWVIGVLGISYWPRNPGASFPASTRKVGGSLGIPVAFWVAVAGLLGAISWLPLLAPPLVFDVTEYHVGAFADFALMGGFGPVPHNFYARFPFPVQSLYYSSLWLGGGWHLGEGSFSDAGPKILHGLMIAGTGFAAGALVAVFYPRRRDLAWVAGLLTVSYPVMLEVALDAYIDGAVAFISTACILGLWIVARRNEPRLVSVVAVIFGGVLASKYTVLQMWMIPTVLAFGYPVLRQLSISRLVIMVILAGMAPGFWWGRNWFLYGNPLEPFAARFFHAGNAGAILRESFYVESHFPQPFWTVNYWVSLPRRVAGLDVLVLAICSMPVLRFLGKGRGDWSKAIPSLFKGASVGFPFLAILVFVGTSYLLWNTIRESQQRFLLPLIPLGAAGAAAALAHPRVVRGWRWAGAGLLALFVVQAWVFQGLKIHQAGIVEYALARRPNNHPNQRRATEAYLIRNLGALGEVAVEVRRREIPGSAMILTFEARPYLFPLGARYCTVWDDDPLLEFAASKSQAVGRSLEVRELVQALLESGISHLVINDGELLRYIDQYARPAQYAGAGVDPLSGDRARQLFLGTPTPEDFYPPFFRHPQWPGTRVALRQLLRVARQQPTFHSGHGAVRVILYDLREFPGLGT